MLQRLAILPLLMICLLGVSKCAHSPALNVAFYRGSSYEQAIISDRLNDKISCGDRRIDEYACLSYDDIALIYRTIQSCKKW